MRLFRPTGLFCLGLMLSLWLGGGFLWPYQSEYSPVKIEGVRATNGLSTNAVQCIVQDHQGYLWLGTQDGLNKFDGYRFTTYQPKSSVPGTLSDNFILSLCVDRDGTLWIGTHFGGLNRFNWKTESFVQFRHDPDDPSSISSDYVSCIYQDRAGMLWVGTIRGGLNRMDGVTETFTCFRHDRRNNSSISSDSILSIYEDREGTLWVGTLGGGLNRYDWRTDRFTRYLHDPGDPTTISGNEVMAVYQDSGGGLWLGTSGGLDRFIRGENRFVHYRHEPGNLKSLCHNAVGAICEDHSGRLWIGTGTANTVGNGISLLDLKTQAIIPSNQWNVAPGELENSTVRAICKDTVGAMWLGAFGKGLYQYDSRRYRFLCFGGKNQPCGITGGRNVWAIHEDGDGGLWVGTIDGGLNYLNRRTRRFKNFKNKRNDRFSLIDNSVRALYEDSAGFIWVGTDSGLARLDKSTGRFNHFVSRADEPQSLSSNRVTAVTEDHRKNLWVGTWGGGLNKREKGTGNFQRFLYSPGNPRSISGNKITCLFVDHGGNLWAGTSADGINRFIPSENAFKRYRNEPGNGNSLSVDTAMSICETVTAEREILWIGTWGGGLNGFERKTGGFEYYTTEHGLASNSIYGLLVDEEGNLWMSTNKGISKFNPREITCANYTVADGLQGNEFNQGAYHLGPSGQMYFGGPHGFNCFYPSEITSNRNIPPIVLTDFKIFGHSIKGKTPYRLKYGKNNEMSIRLDHRETHFTFEFAALEYTNPFNNQYAYKLEGFDGDWIWCGTRKSADYTNLDGGNYVLRIMGSNNDGIWNKEGISLRITITPPLWENWWFQALVLAILLVSGALPFYIRAKKFRVEILHQEQAQKVMKRSMAEFQKARELMEVRHAEVLKLVSAISSILIAIDSRGRVYQWNEPAEKFFNILHGEIDRQSFVEVLARCIKKEDLEAILKRGIDIADGQRERRGGASGTVLSGTSAVHEMEIRVNVNESHRLLSVHLNPILDKTGVQRGLLLLCEDITRRRVEEARKNLLLKLQSVGQMHAGISHEINTPIQYIRINSKIISNFFDKLLTFYDRCKKRLDNMTGEKERQVVEEVLSWVDESAISSSMASGLEATEMIEEGVNRVLEVSKAMKEVFHPGGEHMELCNLNELLKSTLIVSRYHIRKYAEIETAWEENLPLIMCFPGQLNQVFLNLLGNAADAVKEGGKRGKVTISSCRRDNEVVVEICDTGTGIPQELKEKIFFPFFTTKGFGLGTGQGLSMAKKIIEENHGGKIYFESRSNAGTSFFIHLPLERGRV